MTPPWTAHRLADAHTILLLMFADRLRMGGTTEIAFSKEYLESESWSRMHIQLYDDPDRGIIVVAFRNSGPDALNDGVAEAEYEIIEEPQVLPTPPKLLLP